MAGNEISEDEFEGWVPPLRGLLRSVGTADVAKTLIARRLQDGVLRAIARIVVVGPDKLDFITVHPTAFGNWAYLVDNDFWSGGDLVGFRRNLETGRDVEFRFYDVRFHPEDFNTHIAAPGAEVAVNSKVANQNALPSPPSAAKPPKVSRSDLRDWIAQFGKANPGSPFRVILDNARAHFRRAWVSELAVKDEIAELKMTLSVGNPKITRK